MRNHKLEYCTLVLIASLVASLGADAADESNHTSIPTVPPTVTPIQGDDFSARQARYRGSDTQSNFDYINTHDQQDKKEECRRDLLDHYRNRRCQDHRETTALVEENINATRDFFLIRNNLLPSSSDQQERENALLIMEMANHFRLDQKEYADGTPLRKACSAGSRSYQILLGVLLAQFISSLFDLSNDTGVTKKITQSNSKARQNLWKSSAHTAKPIGIKHKPGQPSYRSGR